MGVGTAGKDPPGELGVNLGSSEKLKQRYRFEEPGAIRD